MYLNLTTASSRALRLALLGNAAFSAASGVLVLIAEPLVLSWLGLNAAPVWPIGTLLVLFAVYLLWMSRQSRLPAVLVRGVIAGDWAWVLGSVALVALQRDLFSTFGTLLIVDIAVIVMVFALLQWRSLRALSSQSA